MTYNCAECGAGPYDTKRGVRRHWKEEHTDYELETPDEHLPDDDSEQRDFAGEEPDDSDYNPRYVETNEPPNTEETRLGDFSE